MTDKKKQFEKYRDFIAKTDRLAESLSKMHGSHMQCKARCSQCCMDYKIFPIEFHFIVEALKNRDVEINDTLEEDSCIFLNKDLCSIYDVRPFICRTHGLPLLYVNSDDEWELSTCELNFMQFDEDFHFDNSFPQDRFNSELFMLNKTFVALPEFSAYNETTLISVREIKRRQ